MNSVLKVALGLAMVGAGVSSAQAVLIENGASTTLFYDNFESVSPGNAPSAAVGTWALSGVPAAVVASGTPTAAEGDNYLQETRAGTAFADFGQQTSGTLHAEFMMYIRSANFADHGAQIILRNDALSAYELILSAQTDGSVKYYDGVGYSSSLATVTFDTWQKWTIDVDLAGTYTFSIAGQQGFATNDSLHEGATDARYLVFSTGGGTNPQYLLDAVPVPEPVSAGMALLGAAGLAMGRRRR